MHFKPTSRTNSIVKKQTSLSSKQHSCQNRWASFVFQCRKVDCPPYSIKLAWKYLAKIWKCFLHKVNSSRSLCESFIILNISIQAANIFHISDTSIQLWPSTGPLPRKLKLEICSKKYEYIAIRIFSDERKTDEWRRRNCLSKKMQHILGHIKENYIIAIRCECKF